MQGRAKTLDEIPLAGVSATLSSALLGGMASGMLGDRTELVAKRWVATRDLLGDREPPYYLTAIIEIFDALSGANARSATAKVDIERQMEVVREVMSTGLVDRRDWNHLVQGRPDLANIFDLMRGPREDRTKHFRSSTQMLKAAFTPEKHGMAACLAGCLLALVGDGSFQYLPLCREFGGEIPGATVWFGLWSSLLKTSDVLSGGGSLGRRAARDLFVEVEPFEAPKDDISYDELKVLGVDTYGATKFRSAQQTSLSVELLPGISAKFRTKNAQKNDGDRERRISPEDVSELRFLLDRAEKVVDRIEEGIDSGGPKRGGEVIKARRRR
jgi:hypothetical protein